MIWLIAVDGICNLFDRSCLAISDIHYEKLLVMAILRTNWLDKLVVVVVGVIGWLVILHSKCRKI